MTFTGDTSTLPFNGLLADLEERWSHSVAFVVPPRTTWPLPLYELALMTARSVRGMGIDDARLQVISPEATPMALFGAQASGAVSDLLDKAGIEFRGKSYARPGEHGLPELMPAGERIDAERIVALSTLEGPQLAGVPADERGVILIDHNGRVRGIDDVYAPAMARHTPSSRKASPASSPTRSPSNSPPPAVPTSSLSRSVQCCAAGY